MSNSTSNPKVMRLTMAQALVKFLQVQFSERDGRSRRLIPGIFGIFGHGNVTGLGQALEEYGQALPYYQPRNEQSMVHTATAYAKTTQRQSTYACAASIGPGSTNMLTGAATATINRLPVLLLPSDYFATRHQGPVLQQLEHPVSADLSVNDCFRPVSRFFDRISRPEQLLTALPEAMRVLTDPVETGAVTLALPQDVQSHAWDYPAHFFEPQTWRIERRMPHPDRIAEALTLLKQAKRPLIVAGGGVQYADGCEDLQQFAELCGIPVAETCAAKGCMTRRSPLSVGGLGIEGTTAAAKLAARADLVIAIGTRLTDVVTGSQTTFQNPEVKFIAINVAGHDARKQGALPILADAREALRALTAAARAAQLKPTPAYLQEIAAVGEEWEQIKREQAFRSFPSEALSQGELIHTLNQEAREGDTVVAAAGGAPGDLLKLWDTTGGARCHIEFGNSCMGYEIPGGLGVRLQQPSGEVFVFIGDGTYLMSPSELVTAAQENLKITVVIAENHGFQVIRRLQMWRSGRSFGNEFRERDPEKNRLDGPYVQLDLARSAEGFGARAWRVKNAAELRTALREAREETRPCVIVAETEKHRYVPGAGVWWDAAPAEVSHDSVTQQIRTAFEQDKARLQRFHY